MAFLHSLDELTVPTDLLPPFFGDELVSIKRRALMVLSNRSVAEINAAHAGIELMLEEGESEIVDALFQGEENDDGEREFVRQSHARMLMVYIGLFDIQGQEDFPNATWAEYFAVIALWRLKFGIEQIKRTAGQVPDASPEGGFQRLGKAFVALQDALEAATIAEGLIYHELQTKLVLNKTESNRKQKISLTARRAIQQRHEPLTQLKRECIEYFRRSGANNLADSVRKFLRTQPEERLKGLNLRDPQRILTETLYQYRSGEISSHIWPG